MEESDRVVVAIGTAEFPVVGREGAVEISGLGMRLFWKE